ncbi:hypothetical protein [Pontibacter harenae]|uniref:hypothetical protein n=1 Tax=Pontibacter harenae TaxID=2894083 RepID=UPI001E524629|nr:hypothetical protein [Pontibacter harenae]MCC9167462.1 hypothetical protein [Pontibacter harenae]
MKYDNYTTYDFVIDPYFQKWVLYSDEETDTFWQNWIAEHLSKKSDIQDAVEVIVDLGFKSDIAANRAFIEVWNIINPGKLTANDS